MRDGPLGPGLATVMKAALAGISGMLLVCCLLLSSVYLAYGAFVAAVAAMGSVLAWAFLGRSFLTFSFYFI